MRNAAQARIDLGAIRHNAELLRARAGSAELMAVVKADGYGHGIVPAASAALAGGATWLGVAFLPEAMALRSAGIEAPILCWMGTPGEPYDEAIALGVDLGVGAVWLIEEIAAAATRAGRPARVQLKVDTGLSRGGAWPDTWPDVVNAALAAEAAGHIEVVGVWSHLARADEPGHPSIGRQLQVFSEAVALAEDAGLRPSLRHLANSPAALTVPEARFDLVRCGIAVYGLSPVPQQDDPGLRPAMTLVGKVALTKRVGGGVGVSYGHRYITSGDTTLALIPLGYADGVPRHGSNRLDVFAAGRRRRVAGTVCMDQFVIDVGDDEIAVGDEVVLFGPGDGGEPTAREWADAIGTIPYEIVTRIGPRVPRVYVPADGVPPVPSSSSGTLSSPVTSPAARPTRPTQPEEPEEPERPTGAAQPMAEASRPAMRPATEAMPPTSTTGPAADVRDVRAVRGVRGTATSPA